MSNDRERLIKASAALALGDGQLGPWPTIVKAVTTNTILVVGIMYMVGYVIVNGYQARYMTYTAGSLQLRHLSAGFLYVFLTMAEIGVIVFASIQGIAQGIARVEDKAVERKFKAGGLVGHLSRIGEIGHFVTTGVMFVVFGGGSVFGLLRFGGSVGLGAMITAGRTWFLINVVIAGVVLLGLYIEARSRAKTVRFNSAEEVRPSNTEVETIPELNDAERGQVKRLILRDMASGLVTPIILLVLGFWSLDSFQEIYGRLRPDYGGGALYRVRLSFSQPDKLSVAVRDKLDTVNKCVLLVDRDSSFIFLLAVTGDNKSLVTVPAATIEEMDILPQAPMHPVDAGNVCLTPKPTG